MHYIYRPVIKLISDCIDYRKNTQNSNKKRFLVQMGIKVRKVKEVKNFTQKKG